MLPKEFENRMKNMLGEEYTAFLSSYDEKKWQSLRINTLKAKKENFLSEKKFSLEPVAWCEAGYYYGDGEQPGKHPYHEAGVYYIQEASAMAPGTYLEAQPGERILDLCAAPGGKSTQAACMLQGEGLLVCNEIHPARAKILSENIERMGVRNALVTNETPQTLEKAFPLYFDRILVDAPCSGEGMFRKNEEARQEWSPVNVELCARRQQEILQCASNMLKPGGRLVYSTCTFAPLENENIVGWFLKNHPDFTIKEVKKWDGMAAGESTWMEEPIEEIKGTLRLWPHKLRGEGHYVAVLERDLSGTVGKEPLVEKGISEKECKEYFEFAKQYLKIPPRGKLIRFGEQLYIAPDELPSLHRLRVLRPGLHLGTMKKNRFEPSHALALALKPSEVKNSLQLLADGEEIHAYLRGETFQAEGEKGWYLICAGDYSIGWGKLSGGIMKNHYPKGLRKN
ncbi:MAG: RsmF rRNA methyltransferase first C-terminal domain-containing protein [Acetivibrio ethanolgignens]